MTADTPTAAPPAAAWSLQHRLRGRLLLALAVVWLAAATISVIQQRHELDEVLDSALIETTQRILALSGGSTDADSLPHDETVRFQLLRSDGTLLWHSREAPTTPMAHLDGGNRIYTEGSWRMVVQYSRDGQRIAIAGESLDEREEAMAGAAKSLLIPLAVLLPLAALIVTWVLQQGFAAVAPLQAALAERPANDLRPLPEADLPTELAPLVRAVNELFERVQRLREGERSFAANSAHELRTPLAAARAQAQRLAAETPEGPQRERARALIRQIDRLHTLASKLLQLSRVDSGLGMGDAAVDLNALCGWVIDEFRSDQPRITRVPSPTTVLARSDLDALGMALRNLIENALRHAGPDARVHVEVHAPATLVVWDDGGGVPAETLDALRRPFARGESPASGHGLGLAIAETVARQSGGRLELASPHAHGPGLCATLVLQPYTTAATPPEAHAR